MGNKEISSNNFCPKAPLSNSWNEQSGTGCIIENAVMTVQHGGTYAINIQNASPKIDNNTIVFCIDDNYQSCAIQISGGSPIISNNNILLQSTALNIPAPTGISVYSELPVSGSPIISNNTIEGFGVQGEGGDGILCADYENTNAAAEIFGNILTGCGRGIETGDNDQITNNLIYNCSLGISAGGSPAIENNTIIGNPTGTGIEVDSSSASIFYNNIYNNQYNVYNGISNNIDVPNNWWGATDSQAINQTMYDFKDDFNFGVINFVPFLTEPNFEAPICINASAGAGGSISPSGIFSLNYGGGKSFTITPNTDYDILDVAVNGTSVGAVSSYNIQNVRGVTTISATFTPTPTPSPTPTPTSIPTPTPTPTLPFNDNFANLNAWTIVDGTWTPTSGGVQGSSSAEALMYAGPSSWTDYQITTPVTISAGGEASIVFRFSDSNDFYWAGIGDWGHQYSISKVVGGTYSEIKGSGTASSNGAGTYSLQVVAQGSTITLNVNNVLVLTTTDSTFASGAIGLRTYDSTMQVGSISASTPAPTPTPTATPTPSPSPSPTPTPTPTPNPTLTPTPTPEPTATPTPTPTPSPTAVATPTPLQTPTPTPTISPSPSPSPSPTPTQQPTTNPTSSPTPSQTTPTPVPTPIISKNGLVTSVTMFPLSYGGFESIGGASGTPMIMFSDGVKIVCFYTFDTTIIPTNAKSNYYTLTVKTEAVINPTYVTAYSIPNIVSDYDSFSQNKGNPVDTIYMSTIGQTYTFDIPAIDISHGNNTIVLESSNNGMDLDEQAIELNSNAQLATVYSTANTPSPITPEFPSLLAIFILFIAVSLCLMATARKRKIT